MNRSFETMFETGVDEMSWDDTVRFEGARKRRERGERAIQGILVVCTCV